MCILKWICLYQNDFSIVFVTNNSFLVPVSSCQKTGITILLTMLRQILHWIWTTLRYLNAYLCFHLQYLLFRFPFLKFWKSYILICQENSTRIRKLSFLSIVLKHRFHQKISSRWVTRWLNTSHIIYDPYDIGNITWPTWWLLYHMIFMHDKLFNGMRTEKCFECCI